MINDLIRRNRGRKRKITGDKFKRIGEPEPTAVPKYNRETGHRIVDLEI